MTGATHKLLLGFLALAGFTLGRAEKLPQTVNGLTLAGTQVHSRPLTVRDHAGQILPAVTPGIAVLGGETLAPTDAVREGAREFKVLLTVARLIRQSSLAGVIGLTSRHGLLLPETEQALSRSVLMGVPVVTVADCGLVRPNPDNLFIEAGRLNEAEAKALLAECMLRFGNFTPSADPAHPTVAELESLRAQLMQYQLSFDAANAEGRLTLL